MQSPENGNHDTALQRRSFLGYFGTLGLTSTLFPGALWAQTADGESRVTADMVNAAAGMAGSNSPRNNAGKWSMASTKTWRATRN